MSALSCKKSSVAVTQFDETTITSPNWPDPYPANIDCTWEIKAIIHYEIQLSLIGYNVKQEYVYFNCIHIANVKYFYLVYGHVV